MHLLLTKKTLDSEELFIILYLVTPKALMLSIMFEILE